ncbi:MAG: putative zinc-binding metallopeptidase [Kiritimatiellaeota bacterium]|nr:putative zinc-binding metallopeptidase [Kiritimatiellota bacterium]
MKRLLLVLVCGCLSVAHAQLTSLRKDAKPPEEEVGEATPEMIEEEYLRVAKKCGFAIGYSLSSGVTGDVLSPEDAKAHLPKFFAAMDIFPVRFLRETKLHTVVLCRNLKHNGNRAGGLAVSTGVIYLDVPFGSHVIYHEMFHIADRKRQNEKWTKLNDKQFAYSAGAESDKKTKPSKQEPVKSKEELRKDFVSDYAMTQEMEDRAETFAVMVATPKKFAELAKENPVLAKKAEVVKSIVREFAPAMNKDFWDFIADSDDASRMEDLAKRAKINDQRKKDKKAVLNSGYTK